MSQGYHVIAVLAAVFLVGCGDLSTDSVSTARDTLRYTYICCDDTFIDTTFYSWEVNATRIVTRDRPFIGDTVPTELRWPSSGYYGQVIPQFPAGRYCTTFVDNPGVEDTVVVHDSINNNVVMHDTVILKVAPDAAMEFQRYHGPYFASLDSIRASLDTVREGFWDRVSIRTMHYEGDSAFLTLIDYPTFVSFDARQNCTEFDFYAGLQACIAYMFKSSVLSASTTSLIAAPDSLSLDSTYIWHIVIENRYGLGDSVEVQTRVKPYTEWKSGG